MLHTSNPAVLVQGITGREGSFWTERMIASGTSIVAGVSPGKSGRSHCDVPVYNSVAAACAGHEVDATVLFVPPMAVRAAAMEAIDRAIPWIIILTEHVPVQDTMVIRAAAERKGVKIIGPNSPGLVKPGRWSIGIMPGWLPTMFKAGAVGVVSRSGSLGALACVNLVGAGLGQSTFIGLGGDPIVGVTFTDVLAFYETDDATDAVVMIGELGGAMEEQAAGLVAKMRKPVVAFVAGTSAPEGRRMGHAGAIMSERIGRAGGKIEVLRAAGARIARLPSDIPSLLVNSGSVRQV